MTPLKPIKVIGRVVGSLSPAGWFVSPHGYNLYRVQAGDTLADLADQYLSDVADTNTGELAIYELQSNAWKATRPSIASVRAGDVLFMPQAAIDKAKALGFASGGGGMPPAQDRGVGSVDQLGSGGSGTLAPGAVAPISAGGAIAPVTPASPAAPAPSVAPSAAIAKMKSSPALLAIGGIAAVLGIGAIGFAAHHHAKRSNPRRRRGRRHAVRVNPRSWYGCDADCG